MVFSEVKDESGGNGHKGDVTRGKLSIIGTSTDVDDVRGDTGATQGETHGPNLTWQRIDQGRGLDTSWTVRGDPDLTRQRVDCGEGLYTF